MSWQIRSATRPNSVWNTGTEVPGPIPAEASESGSCTFRYFATMLPPRSSSTALL